MPKTIKLLLVDDEVGFVDVLEQTVIQTEYGRYGSL